MSRRVENQPTLFQKQAQVHIGIKEIKISLFFQLSAKMNMEKKYAEVLKRQVNILTYFTGLCRDTHLY